MTYEEWYLEHAAKHKKIVTKLQKRNYTQAEIIDYFNFDDMLKNENDFCLLYKDNKKCHDMENLNCYLCACPYFRFDDAGIKQVEEGTLYSVCDIECKDGAQGVYSGKVHQDCSKCKIPHQRSYIEKHFNLDWKKIMKTCNLSADKK